MPRPWRYDRVIARYVPDVAEPLPRPGKQGREDDRGTWLQREMRRARAHVERRLALAIDRGFLPKVEVPRSLAILERAIGDDIRLAIARRRAQYAWIDNLAKAADALLDQCVEVAGDPDHPAPHLVFGARDIEGFEMDEEWLAAERGSREPLPSDRAWRAIRDVFDDQLLDAQLQRVDLLARVSAVAEAANALLDQWENPPDPRRISFMHAARCADPVSERFASECLAHGLRPVEAAMIEALVTTPVPAPAGAKKHPLRANAATAREAPTRGASWFDAPDVALRRWREAYERLFERCGIDPVAGVRSTSAARDQSG